MNRTASEWLDWVLAALPAVFLFAVLPFEIYISNQAELQHDLRVLIPFGGCLGLWLLGSWWGLGAVAEATRVRLVRVLCWLGVFLILADVVAPVQVRELDGVERAVREPWLATVAELGAALLVAAAAARFPLAATRVFAASFLMSLLVASGARTLPMLDLSAGFAASDERRLRHPEPVVQSDGPNVYHITWDSYSGYDFLPRLDEANWREAFDSFVFFADNRANYLFTALSRASYLTGSFYESGSMRDWIENANSGGIARELSDAGYRVSSYTYNPIHLHKRSSQLTTGLGLLSELNVGAGAAGFADLWLVRVAPNFLQEETYRSGLGWLSELYTASTGHDQRVPPTPQRAVAFTSVALMRQLIADEANRAPRGEYVYAHIYLPHGPNVMDRHCDYVPSGTSFLGQERCATRLMVEFLAELERLGRSHDALILFHSDHALYATQASDEEERARAIRGEEVLAGNLRSQGALALEGLTRTLLVVKPPGHSGTPLAISERPTQLVDLPATIFDVLGIEPASPPDRGLSVFAESFLEQRDAPIFIGYRREDPDGRMLFLPDLGEASLNHFSYGRATGWRRHRDVAAQWR